MTDAKREGNCEQCGSLNIEIRKYPVHGCETDCGELADDGTPCRELRPWCSYCGHVGPATVIDWKDRPAPAAPTPKCAHGVSLKRACEECDADAQRHDAPTPTETRAEECTCDSGITLGVHHRKCRAYPPAAPEATDPEEAYRQGYRDGAAAMKAEIEKAMRL